MVNAFFSFRFKEEDRHIVEHIEAILSAEGFKLRLALAREDISIKPPPEKVRSEILRSDCLVAVVTSSSAWIQNEIGMAYMARKPIIVFSEEGADAIRGLSPSITDIISFKRDNLKAIVPLAKKARKAVEIALHHGYKLDWYGDAVYEIISRMEQASKIEIVGRSTSSYFDALNIYVKSRVCENQLNSCDQFQLCVYLVPSDNDVKDIRQSAKRILPKWQKRCPDAKFFILPPERVQLRAILFDRATEKEEGFIGTYTEDEQGIYLGVQQKMERFFPSSAIRRILIDMLERSNPYCVQELSETKMG